MDRFHHLRLVETFRVSFRGPFDFQRTFDRYTKYGADWFWLTPREIREPAAVWTGIPFRGTPIGLRVTPTSGSGKPCVSIAVYGKEHLADKPKNELRQLLRFATGADVNLTPFYRLCKRFPRLRQASERLRGMVELPFIDTFHGVLFAIGLQRATAGRTLRMLSCLADRLGPRLVFDNKSVVLLPTPLSVTRASDIRLRRCGLGYRTKFVRYNANSALVGQVAMLQLAAKPRRAAMDVLRLAFKGLGPYSLSVILPHPSFPVDGWNAPIFRKAFGLSPSAKPERISDYAARHFGGWQKYAHAYLLNNLENRDAS